MKEKLNIYKKSIPYILPFWRLIVIQLFAQLLIILIGLLEPWPLKILIDYVLSDKPMTKNWAKILMPLTAGNKYYILMFVFLTVLILAVVRSLFQMVNSHFSGKSGFGMIHKLRATLFDHLQKLSIGFHTKQSMGDIIYRITNDTYSIYSIFHGGLLPLATSILTLLGVFVIIFKLNFLLTTICIVIVFLIYFIIKFFTPKIEKCSKEKYQAESKIASMVQQSISSIKAIIAYGREKDKKSEFEGKSQQMVNTNVRLTDLQTLFSLAVDFMIAVGTASVVLIAARQVLAGRLTIGDIFVFIDYLGKLFQPVYTISYTIGGLQSSTVSASRVFEVLDTKQEIKDDPQAIPLSSFKESVVFKNVYFGYDEQRPILKDIKLNAKAGERIAIVGPSGSGKSTLINLIPRFYDSIEGEVTIDGINVKKVKLSSLRELVSVVFQEMILFPISIKDNILFARPTATMDEVIKAAKDASAHDFIMNLPQGYDTLVGERGAGLSGGEQQRISIARAFLKNAPILLLDEPTSALDPESEADVMKALERLMHGRTVFVIAHRLATVRNADKILFISDGQVIEEGNHLELMERGGQYRQFHDMYLAGEVDFTGYVAMEEAEAVALVEEGKEGEEGEVSVSEIATKEEMKIGIRDRTTGLFNFAYFFERVETEIRRTKQYGLGLALVFFKIDNLYHILDKHGQEVCDITVKKVAEITKAVIRDVDVAAICDFDKFGMLLFGADSHDAEVTIDAIREKVSYGLKLKYGAQIIVTLSAGISLFPLHGKSKDELIEKAENALGKAVEEGINRTQIFSL